MLFGGWEYTGWRPGRHRQSMAAARTGVDCFAKTAPKCWFCRMLPQSRKSTALLAETERGRGILPTHSGLAWAIALLVLMGMAVAGVSSTWTILTATVDEPTQIASGMEWLDKGTYTYEFQHPPLARIVVALGPYLKGVRSFSQPHSTNEGNAILHADGDYWGNLAAARSGTLIFLIQACVVVFLWGRRWFGAATGIWAVLLFVHLPPILGHAGLATLDMACAAAVVTALYQFVRCLENPVRHRFILLGASLALALLCKFTSLAFLGACFTSALIYLALAHRGALAGKVRWGPLSLRVAILVCVVFTILWAGYRFSLASMSAERGAHPAVDRWLARKSLLRDFAYKVVELPVPLSEMGKGLYDAYSHNKAGQSSYLLGEFREIGWWYFFPVVVGVKTPIGFLILIGGGLFAILRSFGSSTWQQRLTVIFPVAITLVCMSSRINLGVRYILPVYPMLAVAGGYAISTCLVFAKRNSRALAVVPLVLAGWVVADCWVSRPDYLAYFNQCAGAYPERILCESDLDWGQDLHRLSQRLKALRVEHVSIAYFGTARLDKADLPPYSILPLEAPAAQGYVAVSVRYLAMEYARAGSFAWLKHRTPLERIGKSIYLYNLGK
jgi:4-amino-4-deoxy-L-arabinose transferase-like glycosyltransferase